MHKYLSAVGFKHIENREQLKKLLSYSEETFQAEQTIKIKDHGEFSERRKCFAKDMGLLICGEYNDDNNYERSYYVPFFEGRGEQIFEDPAVERHAEKESFAGACEYPGIGITIIYYLQNAVEYLSELNFQQLSREKVSLTLSGLSTGGKILLPVLQSNEDFTKREETMRTRTKLIKEAKNGDENAIESLTMEEMDTYSMISQRIEHEDVMSIVASYFMPSGLECDQYSVMGEILYYTRRENMLTKENVYVMTLDCNGLIFDICVNEEDLMGEPETGRRFKGNIWLQGKINFDEM